MPALPATACASLLVLFLPLLLAAQEKPAPRALPVAPGAAVDPRDFRCSRPLAPLPAGWTLLPLDAHVLSCAAEDLSDLRLVDAQNRQIPYLLERLDAPLELELPPPESLAPEAGRSRFLLVLPYGSLPGARLSIATGARVFSRPVRLRQSAASARGERLLAEARWEHADPSTPAPELEIELPRRAAGELTLEIADADNAPLPLTGARLSLPAWRLRFHAPPAAAGPALLYGRPQLAAPRYDLALLAEEARAQPARQAELPPPSPPPAPGWLAGRRGIWAILAVTVVALLALLARLLGRGGSAGPDGKISGSA